MTNYGTKIPDVSAGELRERLSEVTDGKAVKRLFVALAYKHGDAPRDIERRYGIPRSRVYQWLDRIESRGLDEALDDDPRPGRPPRLSAEQRTRLARILDQQRDVVGDATEAWTPATVRDLIESEFDVRYSTRHVRRLMEELMEPRTADRE